MPERCEHFFFLACCCWTADQYAQYPEQTKTKTMVLSFQAQNIVEKVYAGVGNVFGFQLPRSMSANVRCPSSLQTAELVSSVSLSKQDRIPLFYMFIQFLKSKL